MFLSGVGSPLEQIHRWIGLHHELGSGDAGIPDECSSTGLLGSGDPRKRNKQHLHLFTSISKPGMGIPKWRTIMGIRSFYAQVSSFENTTPSQTVRMGFHVESQP